MITRLAYKTLAIYRQLTVCLRLKQLRERNGYSQLETAYKLGISQAAYSRLEKGEIDISLSRLFRLCDIYGTSISKLLEDI